jgi:hypothetical protein
VIIIHQSNMSSEPDFASLNINIPLAVRNYSVEQKLEVYDYLREMDELDKKAYNIAINHLESSFDIYRSNGFKVWKLSRSAK